MDRASHHHQLQQQQQQQHDPASITRGPDMLDPIWVETGLKAASDILIPQLKKAFAGSSDDKEEQDSGSKQQQRQKPQRPQMYSYQHPQNPVIPLQSAATGRQGPIYNGQQPVKRQGEYYPQGYLPAIKFDHPLPGQHRRPGHGLHLPPGGNNPVLPPPAASERHSVAMRAPHAPDGTRHSSKISGGSPRDHINGFRPLFRPHGTDPNYNPAAAAYLHNQQHNHHGVGVGSVVDTVAEATATATSSPTSSAFPGIDATLNYNTGGEGGQDFRANNYRPQHQQHFKTPSLQFTSPSSNGLFSAEESTTAASGSLGPAFAAVPSSSGARLPEAAIDRPEVTR